MHIKILLVMLFSAAVNSDDLFGSKLIGKYFDRCVQKDEVFKCLKIQLLKLTNRAIEMKSVNIFEGANLVSHQRESKRLRSGLVLNETKLEALDSSGLERLLTEAASRFFNTHQLEVKVPELIEEARRLRRRRRRGSLAVYGALAIMGTFLAMSYKGVAMMSTLALMMGKMALLLSAILGLKKLMSNGQENTTVEIIKQPKYSESYSHSTSYEDDKGYHRRAYDVGDAIAPSKIVRTYL